VYHAQALVEHAPGFRGVGGGGVLEPWASSDFLGKSWEILELVAKFWESPAGNSGKILGFSHHQTASFAGAPITARQRCHVRGVGTRPAEGGCRTKGRPERERDSIAR
jgi:hypothetical protein